MAGKDYGIVIISVLSGPLAGQVISAMGEVKLKASGFNITAESSADQLVMNRGFEPKPVVMSADFDRGDIPWEKIANVRFDLTTTEVHAGVTHFLTQAGFTGESQESMKDGKVTGLEIACAPRSYRRRTQ